MDYAAARAYLDSFVNIERQPQGADVKALITLDRVRELAARLGNPQDTFPNLHVAGTKGKGSTCAFVEAILTAAGFRVGLYTSPHLQDVRERIRIGATLIPEADFARLLEASLPAIEIMRRPPAGQRRPTYFEVLTHLAFAWFADQKVDVAVVEVGLGGRLDATNIITPWACGITNISFDHQAILGATLPLIAREKAGIMKPGVPVVIAPQQPDVCETLVECARSAGAPYEFVGRETVRVRSRPRLGGAQEGARLHPSSPEGDSPAPAFRMGGMQDEWPLPQARLRGLDGCVVEAELGLRGRHQAENWAVAVRLADLFHRRKTGARMPADAVRRGSRLVQWPGRLEEVRANGTRLLLDGAHNDHSLRTVLREMSAYLAPPVVLFACAKDKNSVEMLQVLADAGVKAVVFTHSGNARGREPRELADMWRSQTGRDAPCFASCKEGLKAATHMASANGVLLVTGSLYLVGAVKDALARR